MEFDPNGPLETVIYGTRGGYSRVEVSVLQVLQTGHPKSACTVNSAVPSLVLIQYVQ